MDTIVKLGDCKEILGEIRDSSVDLVYLDPPFFTQKVQKLGTRDRTREFYFYDTWTSIDTYSKFLEERLLEIHRVLSPTGSVFFHCDRNAAHIARFLLDKTFGGAMFRSEIIWYSRRWSNSSKNLLPSHQNILFYTKSNEYKFNQIMTDYSLSTNVEQILQRRNRDSFRKSVYARDENGDVLPNGLKKGVPLSDVWDIPFLNPKAKERTGYPTQKPLLLLERIIELVTYKGDLVLDPFCGSGTTLVAANLLERRSIGIDISSEAIEITQDRLNNPIKSRSFLLEKGRESYRNASEYALKHLFELDIVPVHRNKGIDALLRLYGTDNPVTVRVQRPSETLSEAASSLYEASKTKNPHAMILVATQQEYDFGIDYSFPDKLIVVDSTYKTLTSLVRKIMSQDMGTKP